MIELIVRLLVTILLAFLAGKLISKIKLPSILGWLIAGMILGPHAISLMNEKIFDAGWYQTIVHILECAQIIQGTIAAEAVINEIIAVIVAKKGFEWAGEFHAEVNVGAE